MEKNKLRTAVEAYYAALEVVPDHDLHNIKLNMGLCKALVKLGRGKDAVTRCSLVVGMDSASVEALQQVRDASHYRYVPQSIVVSISFLSIIIHSYNVLSNIIKHNIEEQSKVGVEKINGRFGVDASDNLVLCF